MVDATKLITTAQKASSNVRSDRRWAMRSKCNLRPQLLSMAHSNGAFLRKERTELLTLLSRHRGDDAKEASDLDQMKTWALALEDPFARSQREAHFTGSAVVIDLAGER